MLELVADIVDVAVDVAVQGAGMAYQAIVITLFTLWMITLILLTVAVPVAVVGALCYAAAGPETRMKMIGWAPGVHHGMKKAVGLARGLQGRSPEGTQ